MFLAAELGHVGSIMRARRTVVPAIAVVVGGVIAGCGNTELVDVQPTGTTATAPTTADPAAGLWDPCTLPDSAQSAAGLNSSTEQKDVAGVAFEDWKVCSWQDSKKQYTFTMFATRHTLAEVKQRADYGEFVDTTVGTRAAVQYRTTGSTHDYSCSIAAQAPFGFIDFDVLIRHSARDTAPEPCTEVRRLAESLSTSAPA
ncbi:DUF3558 domain-containing protein [Nocardia asteroides]|uniref:DUF3558 domain-containing protein n=1 Tax=Nocardia asteroides TaxID=1824 RepID=UPI00364A6EDB